MLLLRQHGQISWSTHNSRYGITISPHSRLPNQECYMKSIQILKTVHVSILQISSPLLLYPQSHNACDLHHC